MRFPLASSIVTCKVENARIHILLGFMRREELAPESRVATFAAELTTNHNQPDLCDCKTMDELTAHYIQVALGLG